MPAEDDGGGKHAIWRLEIPAQRGDLLLLLLTPTTQLDKKKEKDGKEKDK